MLQLTIFKSDGLMEPSLPAMPSVIQQMKEVSGGDQPIRSSFNDEDKAMFGFTKEKKRNSFGASSANRASTVHIEDKQISSAMLGPRVNLSAKQKKDIAQAFEAFDVTGTGYMNAVDLNSGGLCYADFMTIIEIKLGEDDTKEDIMKSFALFDKDHVGRISFHNLRQVTDELGEDCNDEELAEMLAEADLNDDGTSDEEEFYKILKKSSLY